MSLLNTKTGFTTPWHCSVALMADGEWVSAPAGDFKSDPGLDVVYEDGRPSYFQQKPLRLLDPRVAGNTESDEQASVRLGDHATGLASGSGTKTPEQIVTTEAESTPANSCLDEGQEDRLTELAKTISLEGIKNEKGEVINPFFNSEHPSLDPNSVKFSVKSWLETIMNITARDPERYPRGVAGVAYRNLSAHGFGESTDYQRPLETILFNYST